MRSKQFSFEGPLACASNLPLPTKLASDEGSKFHSLILEAVAYKKYTTFNERITSYQLYQYICDHKRDPSSAAYNFQTYTEDDVIMLSKDWLMINTPEKSLGKHLSDSVFLNYPSHKYLQSLLGLYEKNAEYWIPELYEDHCFLNVHTFQALPNNVIRLAQDVPLAITKNQSYTTNSFALYTHNVLNTDIISVTIVIEFQADIKGNFKKLNKKTDFLL